MGSCSFPWYLSDSTPNYPLIFFSHSILNRPEIDVPCPTINSPYFDLVMSVLKTITNRNNIKVNCFFRININLTLNMGGGVFCDPHHDHDFYHKNIILYFNNCNGGATVVCNSEDNTEEYFYPKEDAIIQFEGLHYGYQPNVGEKKFILVATYF